MIDAYVLLVVLLIVSDADAFYTSAGARRVRRIEFSALNVMVDDKSPLHSKPLLNPFRRWLKTKSNKAFAIFEDL